MKTRTLLGLFLSGQAIFWFGCTEKIDFTRQMNLGKASLENRDATKSIEVFKMAVKSDPSSVQAQRNLARSYMLAKQLDEAMACMEVASQLKEKSPATSYLVGLIHARRSNFKEALPHFEQAVRLDPNTATLRFQLANAYQLTGQIDKGLVQWKETIRLDPLHASTYFKLAMLARRAGNQDEYKRHNESFTHLQKVLGDNQRTPTALERCIYTQPEAVPSKGEPPGSGIPVRFSDASEETFADAASRFATTAVVMDVDDTGQINLLLMGESGAGRFMTLGRNGKFVQTPLKNLQTTTGPFHAGISGDFHDDVPAGTKYDPTLHAMTDTVLVSTNGVSLLQRTGPNEFTNVTARAGLTGIKAYGASWADYEHDGDLDLVLASLTGLQLWQNNGDGTFENVTADVGITNAPTGVAITSVDLDQNLGIDLLVAGNTSSLVFMNQRIGKFSLEPKPPGPGPGARFVLADDFNNDGSIDILWLRENEVTLRLGSGLGSSRIEFKSMVARHAARMDFDNDGWLDLCVVGNRTGTANQGVVSLWRNMGNNTWADVSHTTDLAKLNLPPLLSVLTADLDVDGDTDFLLLTEEGRLHFLRNEGGNANRQLKLRLLGGKTNPSGIGTKLEVRAGPFWITRSVTGFPLEIGLGTNSQLDSIKTIWTNGIEDNQIHVETGTNAMLITEANVASGSCPYLYAWDGHQFRFVTDLLGNSPLGLSMRRGQVLSADPEELVWLGDDDTFRSRQGFFELEVTEELREVLYLDQARMIVVDHPVATEVHSNDKLGPPPYPPAQLRTVSLLKRPIQAMGDDLIDRTQALQEIDGQFAPPGQPLPPPLRGQCYPLALTLDFGPFDNSKPLLLALTGWLQYGDASVNIAASQNSSLRMIPPKLEAQNQEGAWSLVEGSVGMPAGKTKTILFDLTGKLPPGTQKLRLTTTFEIRWDRIVLCEPVPDSSNQIYELDTAVANLAWRGYSEIKSRALGHPTTPDYDKVFPKPPWRTTPQGWCTKYGDVLELVTQRDDQLVVLNGGDALRLKFPADSLPTISSGQTRSYFFYSVGWDKDADYNVVEGDTVEPLPVKKRAGWFDKYNTRWVPTRL